MVVAGDWPADSLIMFKQGFTGPKGLIISTGLLSTEELDGQAIDQLEIVADASSPLVAADNALRQTASLFLASKDAKRGASLVYIHAIDGRRMLVKANSSEVTQMMALLREAQKATAKRTAHATRPPPPSRASEGSQFEPVADAAATSEDSEAVEKAKRMVGRILLWIGIIFLPFIFAWFLLRKGHSTFGRLLGFGWMAFILFLIFVPRSSLPPPATQQEQTQDAENQATAPQTAPTPQAPTGPSAEARAAFEETHNRFMGLANRCDSAWGVMTDAAGSNDAYAAYTAADRGSDICRDVSLAMGRLEFSNLIERDTRRALNRAVDECSLAMVGRQTAMDQAARIFDGNVRPSAVDEFQQRAGFAQQQTIQCMVQYIRAATDAGYEIPEGTE